MGDAIFLYLRSHDGKLPGKLSELYKEGLVMDLSVFSCPASGNQITSEGQIDQLTDYILVPNDSGERKALLLKEKDNFHNGKAHFFFSNWEIKKMPVTSPPGPAPEIPAQYLVKPKPKQTQVKPTQPQPDPVQPQAKPNQPQTKSIQPTSKSVPQPKSTSTPAGPVYSGGGGALPASGPPTVVFVFGFGILIMMLSIVLLLLKNRKSSPAGSGDREKRDSESRSKIDLGIEITEPDKTIHIINFHAAPINVGRDPSNDLVLNDSSVSRIHARITVENGHIFLIDLSKGNRTVLDEAPITQAEVFKDSVIWLGSTCLRIL
ncbi:MAG: FHA domain-containing protein [Candidatus Aminicenantes bacterium]|nr:FHA domain-containing protein [Candidatus Aminicenantes bacterium]